MQASETFSYYKRARLRAERVELLHLYPKKHICLKITNF